MMPIDTAAQELTSFGRKRFVFNSDGWNKVTDNPCV